MKVPVRIVLVAACVSVAPIEFVESAIDEDLESLIDQNTCRMRQIRENFVKNNKRVLEQVTLPPKQKEKLHYILEVGKFDYVSQKLKRKSVDAVQPAEESIEEINAKLGVLDELFQSKRAKNAFRKAAKLWTVNTCVELKEEVFEGTTKEDSDEQIPQQDEESPEGYDDYSDEDYDVAVGVEENEDDELVAVGEEGESKIFGIHGSDVSFSYEFAEEIIIFVSSIKGCSSSLGRTSFYRKGDKHKQVLSLAQECETISIAAHELGHALGFYHTHSRHDRDEFLTVVEGNINRNYSDQFIKQTNETNDNYGLTYDYGSIMQYGATTGAVVKGTPTMVPKDVLYTQTLGSPMISFYDLLMMNMHYNCTDACKNYSTPCKNGGFAHPRNCSKCICPSGYGGDLCDQKRISVVAQKSLFFAKNFEEIHSQCQGGGYNQSKV
ncbi:astacin [Teladorsagia circumcincta]|uniref:Astacin n=1 Tax=Teladorsagia circumcincta TaxID=45464 RepID=A0A2G9TT15_TELCI|nr:astacin [Teladorsagia circumcincta]